MGLLATKEQPRASNALQIEIAAAATQSVHPCWNDAEASGSAWLAAASPEMLMAYAFSHLVSQAASCVWTKTAATDRFEILQSSDAPAHSLKFYRLTTTALRHYSSEAVATLSFKTALRPFHEYYISSHILPLLRGTCSELNFWHIAAIRAAKPYESSSAITLWPSTPTRRLNLIAPVPQMVTEAKAAAAETRQSVVSAKHTASLGLTDTSSVFAIGSGDNAMSLDDFLKWMVTAEQPTYFTTPGATVPSYIDAGGVVCQIIGALSHLHHLVAFKHSDLTAGAVCVAWSPNVSTWTYGAYVSKSVVRTPYRAIIMDYSSATFRIQRSELGSAQPDDTGSVLEFGNTAHQKELRSDLLSFVVDVQRVAGVHAATCAHSAHYTSFNDILNDVISNLASSSSAAAQSDGTVCGACVYDLIARRITTLPDADGPLAGRAAARAAARSKPLKSYVGDVIRSVAPGVPPGGRAEGSAEAASHYATAAERFMESPTRALRDVVAAWETYPPDGTTNMTDARAYVDNLTALLSEGLLQTDAIKHLRADNEDPDLAAASDSYSSVLSALADKKSDGPCDLTTRLRACCATALKGSPAMTPAERLIAALYEVCSSVLLIASRAPTVVTSAPPQSNRPAIKT